MSPALTPTASVAVVEDDASLRRSLVRLLAASAYHTVGYPSAEDLLADSNGSAFQCLVVDIQLGGISGLELSARLAASGSTTPLIFLTAMEDANGHQSLTAHGGRVLLRKSEPAAVLLAAIDRAVRASVSGREPRP